MVLPLVTRSGPSRFRGEVSLPTSCNRGPHAGIGCHGDVWRGIGRGIAHELGIAEATVYLTGCSRAGGSTTDGSADSLATELRKPPSWA